MDNGGEGIAVQNHQGAELSDGSPSRFAEYGT